MFHRARERRSRPRRRLAQLCIAVAAGIWALAHACGRDGNGQGSSVSGAPIEVARELEDGVALAIVYDTSGSMKEPVADAQGTSTAKYVLANRALEKVADQIDAWIARGSAEWPHRIDCALVRFQGESAKFEQTLAPFDGARLRQFAARFATPDGSTPLGEALDLAARTVLQSRRLHKHVVVITDGKNTAGREPVGVLKRIQTASQRAGTSVSAHFIAFDVAASEFDGLEREGAGVVSAADGPQLERELHDILEKEVLLEVEDPPGAPSSGGR